jgi:hypothetical protein
MATSRQRRGTEMDQFEQMHRRHVTGLERALDRAKASGNAKRIAEQQRLVNEARAYVAQNFDK